MSKLIALLHFLLALSGCSLGGTTWTSQVEDDGTRLHSKVRLEDGVARFICMDSSSGQCHYTLFPEACGNQADCRLAPLQRFSVARGEDRQITGMVDFRPCVATTAAAMRADCQPAAAAPASAISRSAAPAAPN